MIYYLLFSFVNQLVIKDCQKSIILDCTVKPTGIAMQHKQLMEPSFHEIYLKETKLLTNCFRYIHALFIIMLT